MHAKIAGICRRYRVSTDIKPVSSMKLSRGLKVTPKTAWHIAQRIRETWADNGLSSGAGA